MIELKKDIGFGFVICQYDEGILEELWLYMISSSEDVFETQVSV